ncbi:MAG: ADP-ribosylglycohydrolase family protein [Aggregatilineales bacterium]
MLGAIAGDIIGSIFENENVKTTEFALFSRFSRFTDDTVLTVAIADAVMHREQHAFRLLDNYHARQAYRTRLRLHGRRYPNAGFGHNFSKWLASHTARAYRSYGNGSAMRVSPIGFAFETLEDVLREAKLSASVTHNHPHGIRGAEAVASAIFLARTGNDKSTIKHYIQQRFSYNLNQTLTSIRPNYTFDSSCQGSVPQAIIAFLESEDFEDAIRNAISIGGDSDTIACIAGGIAQAFYGKVPSHIASQVKLLLDGQLKSVVNEFCERYGCR